MRCSPGKCIKCEKPINRGFGPSSNFVEDEYELDNGDHLMVARCNECLISPPEYGEVMAAVNVALSPRPLDRRIVKVVRSRGYLDIMKEMQGCKCRCGKEIKNTFVYNGSELLCGNCKNGPKLKSVEEAPKSGKKAREHNEKNPRRELKGNHVQV